MGSRGNCIMLHCALCPRDQAALGVYGAIVRSHPKSDTAELQARVHKKGAHIFKMMQKAFPALMSTLGTN